MPLLLADKPLPALSFFGDASSRERAYMVAGGFAVAGHRIQEIEDAVATLREGSGIKSEFRWPKYRGGNRKAGYETLVKYAFELVNARQAALHIIIAKFDGYNHKARDGEDRDTSVNRMYYQLLLHRVAKFYGATRAIHVRLDAGNDSRDVCGIRGAICAAAYREYQAKPNCIRSIEPVQSHKVGLVQMADVIMGAVAAKRNNVQHSSPKGELADFVLRASGRHAWNTDTGFDARFLTVWHHVTKS
jgi:hypothetical protein